MIVLFLLPLLIAPSLQISCIGDSGDPISWFYIQKYPNKTEQHPGEQHRYAYYDAAMSQSGETMFQLKMKFMDKPGESLAETLLQANNDNSIQTIAWNDEPADDLLEGVPTAHSKGVILYDPKNQNGLYIAHSTPKYPAVDSTGKIDITIARSENVYGQNYLCMSLDKDGLENLATGLSLIGTTIYYNGFKDEGLPNLKEFSLGNDASESDPDYKTVGFNIHDKVKLPVVGFFKNPYFTSGFIFEDVMVPVLKDSLMVESWGRPYQTPSCNLQGGFETDNIVKIQIQNDSEGNWINKDDHSKWAIGKDQSKYWVCSGDMNRMTSQAKRGGAFYCFQEKNLWNLLKGVVVSVDDCSSLKENNKEFLAA